MSEEVLEGYKLLNCIVTGQNSQVWEVVESSSHRHFAMKILLSDKANDREARDMLYHEAKVGLELTHPNVIKITYVSKDKTTPFFIMEFFPSGSLKVRIMRKQYEFITTNAHSILKQAATALAYMNTSGWVHRDIKPENMLVNGAIELKIIDFALAQKIKKDDFFSRLKRKLRRIVTVQGTRSYMSPEQIMGLPLDGRSDIYSFGATAYEITTYRPPFRAASEREILTKHLSEKPAPPISYNQELTNEFSDLVMRMLEKKPDKRPQNFHEVLKYLNAIKIYKNEPAKKK